MHPETLELIHTYMMPAHKAGAGETPSRLKRLLSEIVTKQGRFHMTNSYGSWCMFMFHAMQSVDS